jgi:hypothetical protein
MGKDTLVLTLRFYETPFFQTLTCKFAGDRVNISACANVGFGPQEPIQLTGRMA